MKTYNGKEEFSYIPSMFLIILIKTLAVTIIATPIKTITIIFLPVVTFPGSPPETSKYQAPTTMATGAAARATVCRKLIIAFIRSTIFDTLLKGFGKLTAIVKSGKTIMVKTKKTNINIDDFIIDNNTSTKKEVKPFWLYNQKKAVLFSSHFI